MNSNLLKKIFLKGDIFFQKKKIKKKYPIFFIVGNPCTGTTLTHQFLAKTGKFTYISNFLSRFHNLPILGARIDKLFRISSYDRIKFNSINGRTIGISNVHEFGFFWKKVFNGNLKISNKSPFVDNLKRADLILQNLTNIFELPLVIKNNTFISMNLKLVAKYITNSYFIYCSRNKIEIAQSILNARVIQKKNKYEWWSIKPVGDSKILQSSYSDQIIFQILAIENEIEKEIESIKKPILIRSQYEKFCKNPNKLISKINKILFKNKISIIDQEYKSFEIQKGQRVGKKDYLELKASLKKLKRIN